RSVASILQTIGIVAAEQAVAILPPQRLHEQRDPFDDPQVLPFSHLQRSAQRFGKQLVGHFMYPRRSHLFWIAIDEGSSLLVEIDAERLFDQRLARPQCRQVMLAITKPDDAVL